MPPTQRITQHLAVEGAPTGQRPNCFCITGLLCHAAVRAGVGRWVESETMDGHYGYETPDGDRIEFDDAADIMGDVLALDDELCDVLNQLTFANDCRADWSEMIPRARVKLRID